MPKHDPKLGGVDSMEPELNNEQLFGLWAEQRLNEQQQHQFEQRCIEDPTFASQVETFNVFSIQAEQYQSDSAPNWDKSITFTVPEKAKWWQWQGLPSLSFATSVLAIVMVVTGLQVHTDKGAITISFAGQQTEQEIERLVNSRIAEFQETQQLALSNYTQSMQQQQMDTSAQLTQYLLGASRKERREDFAELIKYVNEQRGDDQLFYARQLNQLQKDIYAQPDLLGTGNINE